MNRLRRKPVESSPIPVAAEVLEARSLLSAGAAAAHAAQRHHQAAVPEPALEPFSAKVKGFGEVLIPSLKIDVSLSGSFTPPKAALPAGSTLPVGSKVKISFSFSTDNGGLKLSLKGTFQGTVTKSVVAGELIQSTVSPTGGKLVYTEKQPGHKTLTAKGAPDGTTSQLFQEVSDGSFENLAVIDAFIPTAPAGFVNQSVEVSITA
jgi:hypothetical protein